MKKDILQRLEELYKAQSKIMDEMLQLTDELNKKLDENNETELSNFIVISGDFPWNGEDSSGISKRS